MKYSEAFFTHTEFSIHLGQGQGQDVFIQNNLNKYFLFKLLIHVKNKVNIFLCFAPMNQRLNNLCLLTPKCTKCSTEWRVMFIYFIENLKIRRENVSIIQ